jgi:hypothetical protein
MKTILIAALTILIPMSANATCFGSSAFQTCNDNSGNSYSVRRLGNSTYMNGYNANTGSNWSQNSRTFGNTTYHNGYDAGGNSWNLMQRRIGGSTYYSGTDSDGNFVSGSCNQFGCN